MISRTSGDAPAAVLTTYAIWNGEKDTVAPLAEVDGWPNLDLEILALASAVRCQPAGSLSHAVGHAAGHAAHVPKPHQNIMSATADPGTCTGGDTASSVLRIDGWSMPAAAGETMLVIAPCSADDESRPSTSPT